MERAILAALQLQNTPDWELEESLEELALLAETAGAEVVGIMTQKKDKPEVGLYFGSGKVEELAVLQENLQADVIIVDGELSPAQQRNLEKEISGKVIDRTQVILDIFAQRAASREGKVQVELAQLNYLLPRLTGMGEALSRLGGGIGTRGPGETKLEADRRRIRNRISDLRAELDEVITQRRTQRSSRKQANLPMIALVGYTNAGKSTLLNALTGANVETANKLFATLDPTIRRLELPNRSALCVDTVGFVRKLPHQLVAAFRATLEEVREADVLLHVVDSSSPGAREQYDAVLEVLQELDAYDKPMITVFNKIDQIQADEVPIEVSGPSVRISALNGIGLDELKGVVEATLPDPIVVCEMVFPYNKAGILSELHAQGSVIEEEYQERGIFAKVKLAKSLADRLSDYRS